MPPWTSARHELARAPKLLLLAGLALGTGVGCIASPADGFEVTSTSQTLNFSGYHPYPNAPVRVKAYNFGTRRYDTVASGRSASSPIPPTYWEDTLYSWWAASRTLPSAYWENGRCTGARALIKGETDVSGRTYGMYSWNLEKNAEGCMTDNRNNSDWVSNCSSSQSELTTRDYSNSARAFAVTFNAGFNVNSTCTGLDFGYNHAAGEWSDVRATYRQGSTNRSMSCTETRTSRGRTYGTCRLNFGSISAMRSFIEWHQRNEGRIDVSARDRRCRQALRASQSYTKRPSTYDYSWTRFSSLRSQCAAPPPPPPDPRLHVIGCYCSNVAGTRSAIELNGCLDANASSPATGASLMCGYAAQALQASSGYATSCSFTSLGSPGATCARAGDWSFVLP